MSQDIFIGVDGGATKTKIIIDDSSGQQLAEAIGGPCNIRDDVDACWQSINQALTKALQQANLEIRNKNIIYYAGFGLAGCEVIEAQQAFLAKPHPFKKIKLHSDAYTACLGAHNGKDGTIITIGTGIVGYQIEAQQETKVSGWGFPHGDEGSGAWFGMEAIRYTTKSLDKRIDTTPLTNAIFEKFQKDISSFSTWINQADGTAFSTLAPLVIQYAKKNDPIALKIVHAAIENINEIIAALDSQATLPLCLVGGLADSLIPYLDDNIKSRLVTKKHCAAKGAILMMKNSLDPII